MSANMRYWRLRASLLLLLAVFLPWVEGCSCFIVTSGASQTETLQVTYAADSHTLYGYLQVRIGHGILPGEHLLRLGSCAGLTLGSLSRIYMKTPVRMNTQFFPRSNHSSGDKIKVTDWDSGEYRGVIDQVPLTYNVIGNVNEYGLCITESTWGGLEELASQPDAILDYGSLIYIALQRATSARQALKIMTDLVTEYGYASEGESFTVADPDEVWILEMIGKGGYEKGAVWAAQRIPNGYISAHANQARICSLFPEGNEDEILYSDDAIAFARHIGRFPSDAPDEAFSFSDVYNPLTFETARGCEGRVWDFFHRATAADASIMGPYLDYALGFNLTNRMPLYIKPLAPLRTSDILEAMRSHYEDTPLSFNTDVGAEAFGLPYRWRPLTWTASDGQTYFHERAAATQQTGFNLLAQLRRDMPDPIKALQLFAVDDTDSSVMTPVYGGQTRVPPSYGPGDIAVFEPEKAFWVFNMVANFAYTRYSLIHPDVKQRQKVREEKHQELAASIDNEFVRLWAEDEDKALAMMTNRCVGNAEDLVAEWRKFFGELFVKFMDGNVKTKEDPRQLLPTVKQPGYCIEWRDRVVQETGDRFRVPVAIETMEARG